MSLSEGHAGEHAAAPLDLRRLRMWLQLLRATRAVEARLREYLREEFDTTLPRFDVLAALFASPDGLKMSELSRQLLVSNGNVTGIIERLVGDGLVERVLVEGDRRAMRVRLTPKGREQFSEMAHGHRVLINDLFGALGHERLDALSDALNELRKGGPLRW